MSPKLTLNLGLRWDFFGLVYEHHSNQANFVPSGPPTGGPMYIIPPGPNAGNLSPSFTSLLAQDGITLAVTNKYGKGLGNSQKDKLRSALRFRLPGHAKVGRTRRIRAFLQRIRKPRFLPEPG